MAAPTDFGINEGPNDVVEPRPRDVEWVDYIIIVWNKEVRRTTDAEWKDGRRKRFM